MIRGCSMAFCIISLFFFPLSAAFNPSMEHSTLPWIPGSPKSKCLSSGDAVPEESCGFLIWSCSSWSLASSGPVLLQQRRTAVAGNAVLSSMKAGREG